MESKIEKENNQEKEIKEEDLDKQIEKKIK